MTLFPGLLNNSRARQVIIPSAYTLMTLAMLYPMTLHLRDYIIGGYVDGPIGYWSIWWFRFALVDLGQSPLTTDYMFYPEGANLVFHSMPKALALVSIPIQSVLSLTLTYNLLIVATFIGTALTMYLLAYKVTGARLPAFIAGAFFAFSPYRMYHLSHLNLLTTILMPVYILMIIYGREALDQGEKKAWLYFLVGGQVLAVIAYDSEHNAIYLAIFSVIYLLFYFPWTRARELSGAWLRLAAGMLVTAAVAAVMFLPIAIPAAQEVMREGDYVSFPEWKTIWYHSASLFSFFRPYEGSWLLGSLGPDKEVVAIGWLVLALGVIGTWSFRKVRQVWLWVIVAVVFMLLSLGPRILIGGKPTSIPGPQKLLELIPLIGSPRIPARNIVMTALATSILAAFGLKFLFAKLRNLDRGPSLVALAAAAVLVLFNIEVHPAPKMTSTGVSAIYSEIAESPLQGSLIELPLGWEAAPAGIFGMQRTAHLLNQPVHERKTVAGMVSRAPEENIVAAHYGEPVLYYLSNPVGTEPSEIDESSEAVGYMMKRYQPAFIVIRKDSVEAYSSMGFFRVIEFAPGDIATLDGYITGPLGMEKFAEDDHIVAYRRSN